MSLQKVLAAEDLIALSHQDLDICNASRVSEAVHSIRPNVVINAAAIRRPDDCEQEPDLLQSYLRLYNHDRPHRGYRTQGRTPAQIVWGAQDERD